MPKRISEIADSLRQIGEIQVSDWDFKSLLNTDIKDLEISSSLRKLGNRKVLDWDFRTALPTVHRLAYQEVDLVGWVRRAAHYKVIDWDFRSDGVEEGQGDSDPANPPARAIPDPELLQALVDRLKGFLTYITVNLIDEPARAQIRIHEIGPGVVRFKLVVTQADLHALLGRDGSTASAIRRLLKGVALDEGVHALLEILSHDEDAARSLRE